MENKYYIPELEEFHVGFEYEYVQKDKIWRKGKVDAFGDYIHNTMYFVDRALQQEGIRVKLLDKEDIESLGWKFIKEGDDELYFQIFPMYPNIKYWFEMNFSPEEHYLLIEEWSETGIGKSSFIDKFNGNIKNKSELKRLMKQIGILV